MSCQLRPLCSSCPGERLAPTTWSDSAMAQSRCSFHRSIPGPQARVSAQAPAIVDIIHFFHLKYPGIHLKLCLLLHQSFSEPTVVGFHFPQSLLQFTDRRVPTVLRHRPKCSANTLVDGALRIPFHFHQLKRGRLQWFVQHLRRLERRACKGLREPTSKIVQFKATKNGKY